MCNNFIYLHTGKKAYDIICFILKGPTMCLFYCLLSNIPEININLSGLVSLKIKSKICLRTSQHQLRFFWEQCAKLYIFCWMLVFIFFSFNIPRMLSILFFKPMRMHGNNWVKQIVYSQQARRIANISLLSWAWGRLR